MDVSILEAQRSNFNTKDILVSGVFQFGADGSTLWSESRKDSVALELPRSLDEAYRLQLLDGKPVVLSGTFDAIWCSHACVSAEGRIPSVHFVRKAK